MHLLRMEFTHIIFHTTFLAPCWDLAHFRELVDRARPLRELAWIKIASQQDEFLQTDALCGFLQDFDVTHVLRPACRGLQRFNDGSRPT